ncbi:hypothetical protein LCGC14_0875450 [marine sediment metagenome]|uniref:Uncharacterized protein n=1 Tax=marine sediment metagenome TaxID=412755 RepID=A0A0F9P3I8_9ZZZZ
MSAKPKAAKQQKISAVPNKTFQVATWDGAGEGEKIIVYADSGMGKTTLGSMLPNPVFAGLDDGGRKIRNPITDEPLKNIPGIETFADFRTAIQQPNLLDDYETLVVDTGTILEPLGLSWTLENIKTSKGEIAKSIEHYGYGAGHRHLYDTMRLPLADFDTLIRRGKNVCILCQMQQVEISHSGGENYLCDAPKLAPKHGKQTPSIWGMWIEWADHVFKISNEGVIAAKDSEKSKVAKATSTGNRIIHVHAPEVHYKAKSRSIPPRFPVVSFSDPADDSIWKFLFDEVWRDIPEEGSGE